MNLSKFKVLMIQIIKMDKRIGLKEILLLILPYLALMITIHLLLFSYVHTNEYINNQVKYRTISIEADETYSISSLESVINSFDVIDMYSSTSGNSLIYTVELNDYRNIDLLIESLNSQFKNINLVVPQDIDMEALNMIRVIMVAFLVVVIVINTFLLLIVVSSVSRRMMDFNKFFAVLGYNGKTIGLINNCKLAFYVSCAFILAFTLFYSTHDVFNLLIKKKLEIGNISEMNINYGVISVLYIIMSPLVKTHFSKS